MISWMSIAEFGIYSFAKDIYTLSLNVVATTKFRQLYPFCSSSQKLDKVGTYQDALAYKA